MLMLMLLKLYIKVWYKSGIILDNTMIWYSWYLDKYYSRHWLHIDTYAIRSRDKPMIKRVQIITLSCIVTADSAISVLSPIVKREVLQLKVVAEIKISQLTATSNFSELLVFNCQFRSATIRYKHYVDWTLCCHNINCHFSQWFQLNACPGVMISPL